MRLHPAPLEAPEPRMEKLEQHPTPFLEKGLRNHVYLSLTHTLFPSFFPLTPKEIKSLHMEGEFISTSTF